MINIVFGTNNQGKLKEVKGLANQNGFEILTLKDIGATLVCDETGETFEENAKQKLAAFAHQLSNISVWIAAEDAGMTVDYLNGAPGVRTRRWAGHEMTDQEVVDYTLQQLEGVPYPQRSASFHSSIALAHSSNPSAVTVFSDKVDGKILLKADTTQPIEGLPLRQLFFISEASRMLGDTDDLPPETAGLFKTHRQKAFAKVFNYIKQLQSVQS